MCPGTGESAFRVIYSEHIKDSLRALGQRATELGLGQRFLAALQAIDGALRTNPLDFGEAQYHLDNAKLEVRTGGRDLLFARYAVDAERKLVYLGGFVLFEG